MRPFPFRQSTRTSAGWASPSATPFLSVTPTHGCPTRPERAFTVTSSTFLLPPFLSEGVSPAVPEASSMRLRDRPGAVAGRLGDFARPFGWVSRVGALLALEEHAKVRSMAGRGPDIIISPLSHLVERPRACPGIAPSAPTRMSVRRGTAHAHRTLIYHVFSSSPGPTSPQRHRHRQVPLSHQRIRTFHRSRPFLRHH